VADAKAKGSSAQDSGKNVENLPLFEKAKTKGKTQKHLELRSSQSRKTFDFVFIPL